MEAHTWEPKRKIRKTWKETIKKKNLDNGDHVFMINLLNLLQVFRFLQS